MKKVLIIQLALLGAALILLVLTIFNQNEVVSKPTELHDLVPTGEAADSVPADRESERVGELPVPELMETRFNPSRQPASP